MVIDSDLRSVIIETTRSLREEPSKAPLLMLGIVLEDVLFGTGRFFLLARLLCDKLERSAMLGGDDIRNLLDTITKKTCFKNAEIQDDVQIKSLHSLGNACHLSPLK